MTTEPTTEEIIEQTTEQDETSQLQEQLIALQEEVKAAKEAAARANAESYNAQRRMEQETDKAKKYTLQKFAKDLLDVVDNLERGLDASEKAGADESVLEGLRLTHKSLLSVLEKHGVSVINPAGDKFDPEKHEAVGIAPDVEKDVVGTVLQKGYALNDRTLRPAIVMVGG